LLLLVVIVVPPERLPEVMRTAGKVLRELRLASNTVMRELTSALDDPYNPPYSPPHPTPRNPPPRPAVAAPSTPPVSADPQAQK
jgi:Sec-independent protein translocase protein TatA